MKYSTPIQMQKRVDFLESEIKRLWKCNDDQHNLIEDIAQLFKEQNIFNNAVASKVDARSPTG